MTRDGGIEGVADGGRQQGENIYPRELEEFFFTHPAVADVQVIGIPDERYGEEIVAWIKLHPGHHADDEQLRAFCKARIAHFSILPLLLDNEVSVTRMAAQVVSGIGFLGAGVIMRDGLSGNLARNNASA